MIITAYFYQSGNAPKTGLSPTINIRDISDGSLVVTAGAMTEVGDGTYKYDFTGYDAAKDYSFLCDAGEAISGGVRYSAGTSQSSGDIEIIKKMAYNKVTTVGDIITVYEDNGTDIWKSFSLASKGRVEQ